MRVKTREQRGKSKTDRQRTNETVRKEDDNKEEKEGPTRRGHRTQKTTKKRKGK